MKAQDKAREVAKKIGKESKDKEKKAVAEVKSSLIQLRQNPELAKLYKDNAEVGAKNLGGELPLLKVHKTGKSTTNELADGSQPNDGWFFYKPTMEQFESITCHILTISRGFRADGLNKKDVYHQLMGGVIVEGDAIGDIKPFVTYLTGLKLSPMWDFGKEARKYTKARPVPIPMFSLKIKLTTEEVKNNYGKSWIIKFEIVKDKDNNPVLITDPGLFQFLLDHVEQVEDMIASVIEAKSSEEAGEEIPHPVEEVNKENPDVVPF